MSKKQEHICVIKLSALGDFLISLGAMKAIRAHHKDASITLLTTAPFESMARQSGYCDDIIIDTRPKWYEFLKIGAFKHLLNQPFAAVYDLQHNDRTRFYRHTFFSKNVEWYGMSKAEKHAFQGHAFEREKAILSKANITNVTPDTLDWYDEDVSGFNLPTAYVLMVPGCAPQHPYKRWPAEAYRALASKLAENGYHIVLLGTKHEIDIGRVIENEGKNIHNLINQTSLAQIPTLARQAHGAVGNDTGPMHMIGMTGCPSLVLFSNHSDPVKSKPLGKDVTALQNDDLSTLSVETVHNALPFLNNIDRINHG